MKINLPLFVFMLLTKLTFGQQKSLLISTHLNTKTGKSVEKVSVVVDKVGTCITGNDGKCFYPTLKGTGMSVSIKASLSDYVPINNLELKSYRLSNQKLDTVRVIMSLKAEREKYALAYFEKETGIIIRKSFEQKEKSLYAQINSLVAKMKETKNKQDKAYRDLQNELGDTNKQLDQLQKDKLNEESIAQRLATTLSMLEGEEIPDYASQAYSLFRQGNVEGADKALNGNAIDDQIQQGKLKIKLAEILKESGVKEIIMGIAACLFKAQLNNTLYNFKEAEIWFEKAYQADTNNANTLFEYANFLAEQNRAKRPGELYERALQIYESLAKANPEQYLPKVANTLNNLGMFYSENHIPYTAQQYYERALKIRETLVSINPAKYLAPFAGSLNNFGSFCLDNHLQQLAKSSLERALHIQESLSKVNPSELLPDLAGTLINLGIYYRITKEIKLSSSSYERALEIYEGLVKNNSTKYLPLLAITLNNLGNLYSDVKINTYFKREAEFQLKAKNSYERALRITESLAEITPSYYLPDLALTLNNLGIFYSDNNLQSEARTSYERSLYIYQQLTEINPDKYLPKLGVILTNLGVYYGDNNLPTEAEVSFNQAIQIRKYLVNINPVVNLPDLAQTEANYGSFLIQYEYFNQGDSILVVALERYQNLAMYFKDDFYWKKAEAIVKKLLDEIEKEPNFKQKFFLIQSIIKFSESSSVGDVEMATYYGYASWYALCSNQYIFAEKYALKGLSKDSTQNWMYGSIVLSLVLQNRWNDAKVVFLENKTKSHNNINLKETLLYGLIALEKEGIKHPDFEQVRRLLK